MEPPPREDAPAHHLDLDQLALHLPQLEFFLLCSREPEASVDTSKPAIRRRVKTGQRGRGRRDEVGTTACGPPTARCGGWAVRRESKSPHAVVRRVSRPAAGARL